LDAVALEFLHELERSDAASVALDKSLSAVENQRQQVGGQTHQSGPAVPVELT
jgi:hypothetical protein